MATITDTPNRDRAGAPDLPAARGPISAALLWHLRRPPHDIPALPLADPDLLADEDAVLALYVAYELHYRSFAGVDDGWEWSPSLLRERSRLEAAFQRQIADDVGVVRAAPGDVVDELRAVAAAGSGPSLSAYMGSEGSLSEMREFAIHRSAYQLKEADAHTWAIPRLSGRAKAALVEIQTGEYGVDELAAYLRAIAVCERAPIGDRGMRHLGRVVTHGCKSATKRHWCCSSVISGAHCGLEGR